MKVRVENYYPGELTKDDFFNVKSWDRINDLYVDITFQNVTSIEKLGDGLRIVFNVTESHYFDQSDYAKIIIF